MAYAVSDLRRNSERKSALTIILGDGRDWYFLSLLEPTCSHDTREAICLLLDFRLCLVYNFEEEGESQGPNSVECLVDRNLSNCGYGFSSVIDDPLLSRRTPSIK